jgi:hypothetical protein
VYLEVYLIARLEVVFTYPDQAKTAVVHNALNGHNGCILHRNKLLPSSRSQQEKIPLNRRLGVRVPPGVPKRTHLEPLADESQPTSAEEFLAELRFEKRHLLAELPVDL